MELSKENWKVIYLALEDYITKLEEEYGEGIDKIVYDTYSLSAINADLFANKGENNG